MARFIALSVLVVTVTVMVMVLGASAASSPSDCLSKASSTVFPCVEYVMKGNHTKVGSDCCNPLSGFIGSRPDCICALQQWSLTLNGINLTRAYQLNSLCNITSKSSCNGSPTSSPSTSPSPSMVSKNEGYVIPRFNTLQVFYIVQLFASFLIF